MIRWIFALVMGISLSATAADLSIVDGQGERHIVKTQWLMEQFPAEPIITKNPWAPEVHTYEGIDMAALLAHYGLDQAPVRLIALDNYSVIMQPGELDALRSPILALQKDGKPLTRRDFGPSWLIVDFDRYPELDVERTRNLSIWQLAEIAPES
ncbi:MAG: hypothetical protein ACPGU3_00240 [Litorivicinus sp.]